jgi:predicted RNA-binding protein with EMAP domain
MTKPLQIITYTYLSYDELNYKLRVFKTLIDLIDLQNDLGGQSCKSKLFFKKLVEQIVTFTHLS